MSSLSVILYTALVAAVCLERLFELAISRRNLELALEHGGMEVGFGHFRWMVLLHTTFLFACPAEVWLLERSFVPALGWPMLGLLVLTMVLRYWAVTTLGERWNTRIVLVPGMPIEAAGPYRFVKHPNYVAVVLELAALPLIHGAWLTALVYSAANLWMLWVRIGAEEQALREHCAYDESLADRPRFVPGRG